MQLQDKRSDTHGIWSTQARRPRSVGHTGPQVCEWWLLVCIKCMLELNHTCIILCMKAGILLKQTHCSVRHQLREMIEPAHFVVGLAEITQWHERWVDVERVKACFDDIWIIEVAVDWNWVVLAAPIGVNPVPSWRRQKQWMMNLSRLLYENKVWFLFVNNISYLPVKIRINTTGSSRLSEKIITMVRSEKISDTWFQPWSSPPPPPFTWVLWFGIPWVSQSRLNLDELERLMSVLRVQNKQNGQ